MMQKQRWKARIVGGFLALAGASGLTGCKQQIFLEPADWQEAKRPNIPAALETRPQDPIAPLSPIPNGSPATVLDAKRPLRPITLKEAIAIALEQGNVGSQNGIANPGNIIEAANTFSGLQFSSNQVTDTVRAFLLDPAIAEMNIERSLSKFDARFTTSLAWGKQDQATLNLQQSFSNGDTAQLNSTLAKPLPSGGLAGITMSMNYLNLSSPPPANSGFVTLNSSYTPRVQFIFEQPLMQGFGVETNQLLSSHPGSVLIPGLRPSGGQGVDGILVSRIRNEQARYQFEAQINSLLLNVEAAYWNLYSAYYNLYAQEEALKQSLAGALFFKTRNEGGIERPYRYPQALSQYWNFRQQVIAARARVLDEDRKLRGLLGMKSDEGTIFRPTDEPTEAKLKPDFPSLYAEGLQNQPILIQARQDVKIQQLNMLAQKNQRMADLRVGGFYDVNGLGRRIGGDRADNALASIADNQFNSWQIFLRLDMPLGFRDANAQVRQQQLNLWRSFEALRDLERKEYELLVDAYRKMDEAYATIEASRSARLATQDLVNKYNDRVNGGVFEPDEYINLLQAQRDLASATSAEYRAIAQYNIALASIEFAKGTIQQYNNVTVADGPLPSYVQKKAADHFRAQSLAIKVREHPSNLPLTGLDRYQPMNLETLPDIRPGTNGTFPLPSPLPAPGGPQPQPQLAPAPTPIPIASTVPGSMPAPQTIRGWESWQNAPASGSIVPMPAASDPASSTFKPIGTVSLPTKRPVADVGSGSTTGGPPLSGPGTPISAIPPRR